MLMRTAEETAVLLSYMLKLSGQTRGRVTEKTLKRVGGRSYMRDAFVAMVEAHLDDKGIVMTRLQRGGFGLIRASVLEGAPVVTAKEYLKALLKELKTDAEGRRLAKIRREVEEDLTSAEEEEE